MDLLIDQLFVWPYGIIPMIMLIMGLLCYLLLARPALLPCAQSCTPAAAGTK